MQLSHHNPDPLTEQNAPLVLVDRQDGLMTGIRDYSVAEQKSFGSPKAGSSSPTARN